MRIVGIDASLTATGIAVIDTSGLEDPIYTMTVSSKPGGSDLRQRMFRLDRIAETINNHIEGADLAAIEAPSYGSRNGQAWERAGLWWHVVRRAWGMDVPVVEIPPKSLKKFATGKGNADKALVAAAMTRLWPDAAPDNDNEFDALTLATIGAVRLAPQTLPFTPLERHRATCDAIDWPKEVDAA